MERACNYLFHRTKKQLGARGEAIVADEERVTALFCSCYGTKRRTLLSACSDRLHLFIAHVT